MHVKHWTLPALGALTLLGLANAHPAAAQTYNAADGFSPTNNPNGVWSYGDTPTLGGLFTLYTTSGLFGGVLSYWSNPTSQISVEHNGTGTVLTGGSQTWQPGALSLHDGPQGQFSVVRFTAPTAGDYDILGSFYPGDVDGNTTVNILDDSTSVFSSTRIGNTIAPFSLTETLAAGDTIDFAVGGQYAYGDTALNAVINNASPAVPEPGALPLLGFGLGGLALAVRRRRRLA